MIHSQSVLILVFASELQKLALIKYLHLFFASFKSYLMPIILYLAFKNYRSAGMLELIQVFQQNKRI